jgi:hypothetical protein
MVVNHTNIFDYYHLLSPGSARLHYFPGIIMCRFGVMHMHALSDLFLGRKPPADRPAGATTSSLTSPTRSPNRPEAYRAQSHHRSDDHVRLPPLGLVRFTRD